MNNTESRYWALLAVTIEMFKGVVAAVALVGIGAVIWLAMQVLIGGVADGAEPEPPLCPGLASPQDKYLNELAQKHAQSMADRRHQSHYGFGQRAAAIRAKFSRAQAAEICAESWRWQVNATPREQWAEYVKCWKQSPGHWRVASRKHRLIGVGSARGKNNIWYGVLLAID